MKQILRFAIVFALAGATLLHTGCTKDYSAEIATVKSDLDKFKTETLATQAEQQKAIEKAQADIKTLNEALTAAIKKAETDLAAAKAELNAAISANAKNITSLTKRVETLEGLVIELTGRVSTNEELIKTCQDDIIANRSWAEKTLATKARVEEINTELGKLAKKVADYYTELTAADTQIKNDLAAVKTTADKAAADASNALGKIDRIWQHFDSYYTIAQVDGIKDDLKGAIQTVSDKLDQEIIARQQGDQALAQKLADEIQKLQDQIITPELTAIKKLIAQIAVRVTSISVCPTKVDEICNFRLQPFKAQRLIRATFEVEPVITAQTIKAEDIELTVACARTRDTKSASPASDLNVNYVKTVIDSVYCDADGRLVVIATGVPQAAAGEVHFFALTYNGKDDNGTYSVTSDYAQTKENTEVVMLASKVMFAKKGEPQDVDVLDAADVVKLDYIQAETQTYNPFTPDFSVVYFNEESYDGFLPTGVVPIEKICNYLGIKDEKLYYFISMPTPDVNPVMVKDNRDSFKETIEFKAAEGKSLYEYVDGQAHYTGLKLLIGTPEDVSYDPVRELRQGYQITKIIHEATLDQILLRWNYKTYKSADRKASVKVSEMQGKVVDHGEEILIKDLWKNAMDVKHAKAIKQLDFDGKVPSKFTFGVWDQQALDYLDELSAQGVNLPGPNDGEKIYKDTIVKDCPSDSFRFAVSVKAEAHMPNQIRVFPVTVKGSVTKSIDVTIEKVLESVLKKNGAVDSRLISGLSGDDATYEKVFAAANDCYNAATFIYKADGDVKPGFTQVWDSANDKLKVTVPAGILNYAKTTNIDVVVSTIFGFTYTITIKATTEAAPFELRLRPYAKEGVVRAKFKTETAAPVKGRYTIEDLNYNWQVELVPVAGKSFSDINEEADCIAVTFGYAPEANVTGKPDITANPVFVDFAQGDATYKPLKNGIMKWYKYDGLNLNMSAQLVVVPGGALSQETPVNVNAPVNYTLQTVKPVEWVSTVVDGKTIVASNTYTKIPATPLEMNLFNGIQVNGADQEGKITVMDIMSSATGENIDPLYKGESDNVGNNETKLVFTVGTTLQATYVYENGNKEAVTLTQGYDYDWYELDPTHHNCLVLTKDNLKANLLIDIPVQLNYYLDYGHTQAYKGYVSIKIQQQ